MERLKDFLLVEKHVGATLRRTLVESAAKASDIVTSAVRVHLSDLVAPGQTQMLARVKLETLSPVAKESLEQDLATATSNDEKKKIQAALTEYEAIVQQAAVLSAAMATCSTHLECTIEILGSPLVLQPPMMPLLPSVSIEEMIPQRDLVDEREQKEDPIADLRSEIRCVVLMLLREYDDSFNGSGVGDSFQSSADVTNSSKDRDEKKQKLIFRLNTQGVYHNFKETLKKRIIPVIRDRFARSEFADDDDVDEGNELQQDGPATAKQSKTDGKKKEYFGHVYTLVMQEVHAVLHEAVYSDADALEKTHASVQGRPSEKEIMDILDSLKLKAMENQVTGDMDKSETMHLDRIAFAEEHGADFLLAQQQQNHSQSQQQQHTHHPAPYALETAWFDYARLSLFQGDFEKAGASLRQSLSLNVHALPAILAYTSLLCELSDFVHAEDFAKTAVTEALAAYSASLFPLAGDSSKKKWVDVVLAHGLLALYFVLSGRDTTGNFATFELLKAQQVLQHDGGEVWKNACMSSVWIFLAEYTHELKLRSLTQIALQLANSYRKPRDVLSVHERVIKRAIEAELSLLSGELDQATKLLRDALEIDPSHPFAWLMLGKAYLMKENQTETAVECLQRALETHDLLRSEELRLGLYVHLGLVLLQASQFGNAEAVFLESCDEFRVASNWLGVGIACLRMEKWEPAHMALAEANRLDSTNPDVWGYLALYALSASAHVAAQEEAEAKRFVAQALRYDLSNPVLLRELSNGFVAIDRLEDAERLLRRSLVCQDSSLTRKTLADVLAAQNCAEDALGQYKQTLESSADVLERRALLEECAKLLTTLGRPDEASEYRRMAGQFQLEQESSAD